MAIFKSGRWRSARGYHIGGRFVSNPTVARQLRVPARAVSGTHRQPARWTEVTAVCRIKLGPRGKERYVEAVRRVTIHDATARQIREARSKVRAWVVKSVEKKLGRAKVTAKARTVVGTEVRRRRRRPKAGKRVEVRDMGRYKRDEYDEGSP